MWISKKKTHEFAVATFCIHSRPLRLAVLPLWRLPVTWGRDEWVARDFHVFFLLNVAVQNLRILKITGKNEEERNIVF